MSFWSGFNLSDVALKLQVENHDTLPITKSSRGIAVLTMLGLLLFGSILLLVISSLNDLSISVFDVLLSWIIYLPFLYFVYKGKQWAMIILALLYTADKYYSTQAVAPGHFSISVIIFWLIGIGPLWAAFQVEQAYKKIKTDSPTSVITGQE